MDNDDCKTCESLRDSLDMRERRIRQLEKALADERELCAQIAQQAVRYHYAWDGEVVADAVRRGQKGPTPDTMVKLT